MNKTYFGTDGIRARVGDENMTPEFAVKLGYCAGRAFKENWQRNNRPLVLIGKDTRISGYLFEGALQSGFAAAGVDVAMLGPLPTPGIAYLTRTFHGCAGVVISASHNPYYDNGIKFFSAGGTKLDDALEQKITDYLNEYADKPLDLEKSNGLGKARRINDAQGRYIEHCKSSIPPRMEFNGLKLVLDCANGATYQVAPAVFRELGADVTVIHNEPDGRNINADCGSTDVKSLKAKVLVSGADMGIAFDGDGDRVMMIDAKGNEIDGDAIMYLIAKGLVLRKKKIPGVVGTVMTNMGTIAAIKALGIDFKAAAVGDRHVMEALLENDWKLGGESSGHLIYLQKSTTGDGIVAALQVLAVLQQTGKTLAELLDGYTLYPMKMVNVTVSDKAAVMQNEALQAAILAKNAELNGVGRLLVRASGTEPKVRVMAEAENEQLVETTVQQFVELVEQTGANT